jgi:hypothetical protein
VDSSKDVGYYKPVRSRALVVLVRAVLGGANTIERDGTLDGAVDTHACKVHHVFLVVRPLDHLNAPSRSTGIFSASGR